MPAIALCDYIKNENPNAIIRFAGRPDSIEEKMAKNAGLDFVHIRSASLKKGIFSKISFFFLLTLGFLKSFFYILKFKPDFIVGFGGYTSFPLLFSGLMLKRKVVVHEANAVPGKVVAFLVRHGALLAYGALSDNDKMNDLIIQAVMKKSAAFTGNPIRKSTFSIDKKCGLQSTKFVDCNPIILIIGGSQGARALNTTVAKGICLLKNEIDDIQVAHITGKNDVEKVRDLYDSANIDNYVIDFSDNIGELYNIADVAVTRAGALTIAELSAAGLPAVLIPFPYATDDHQAENARLMAEQGAAKIIFEKDLTPENISDILKNILSNNDLKREMKEAAENFAVKDADKFLYEFIINHDEN